MSEDLKCRHGRSCCPKIFDQINKTIFNLQSDKTQLLNRNGDILARCETLESENAKLKEIERKRIDQVSQLVAEIHGFSFTVGQLRKALEHCRQRPHEHNPLPLWNGPTRCDVIDEALLLPIPAGSTGCTACGGVILADTEDWKFPLCDYHYSEIEHLIPPLRSEKEKAVIEIARKAVWGRRHLTEWNELADALVALDGETNGK